MTTLTVYQTDGTGAYLYPLEANEIALQPGEFNIPFGAVETAPPVASSGQVPQWSNGAWTIVEDSRNLTFFVVATGDTYTLGSQIEVDSASVSFNGLGAVPAWLTTTAPTSSAEASDADATNS